MSTKINIPRAAPAKQKKQRRSIKTDRDFLTSLLKRGEATVVDAKLLKKNTKSAVWSHFGAIRLESESFTHETIDLESIVDQATSTPPATAAAKASKKRKARVTPPKQKRPRRSIKTDRDYLTGLLQNGTAKVVDARHLKKNIKSAVWSHYGAISVGDNISNPAIDVESNVDDGKIMQICKNFVACNDCFTVFKYDGHAYGTTGLVKHIKLCQKTAERPQLKIEPNDEIEIQQQQNQQEQEQQQHQADQINQENSGQEAIAILQHQDGISEEQIASDGEGTIMVIVYEDTNDGGVVMSV
ncbi:hypothetical protein GZH46_01094, partial [Fragariocoptes setiger]